jgi:pyruvate/2-oxoglutarate dehydrogenase complex dihydrolipoamide acyltransferase (E2) component
VFEFKLPDLGEGIHEGEILKWHVAAGAPVVEDAPLLDVETDKAAVTIPSPKGGIVVSLTGKAGDTVATGQVIAVIDEVNKAAPARVVEAAQATTKTSGDTADAKRTRVEPSIRDSEIRPAVPAVTTTVAPSSVVPAAPAVRRLARELGVDLHLLTPTGPAGRVVSDDVRR